MTISPIKIYEDFRYNKISKHDAVDFLILLIENSQEIRIRISALDLINKIELYSNNLFGFIENLFISDLNEDIRYLALQIIMKKFKDHALRPLLWALQHEPSHRILLSILLCLKQTNNQCGRVILVDEIGKIAYRERKLNFPYQDIFMNIKNYTNADLIEIILEYHCLSNLRSKFSNLELKFENGLVTELDFSKVDKKTIYWRDIDDFQNLNGMAEIKYLKNLKRIKLFPIEWILSHELKFQYFIDSIDILEKINITIIRNSFIEKIRNIKNNDLLCEFEDSLDLSQNMWDFSVSQLAKFLKNYLILSYLKKKFPDIKYELKRGKITKLDLEGMPLIKVPSFFCHLSSLKILNLRNCRIYSIPDEIDQLHKLEVLNLSMNNLEHVPKSLFSLKSLKILNLEENKRNLGRDQLLSINELSKGLIKNLTIGL